MKRIVILFLALLIMPIATFGISLSELKNKSDTIILVGTSPDSEAYADRNTARLLRSNPPYYTMSSEFYFVNYKNATITYGYAMINYDYNRSLKVLANNLVARHPNERAKMIKSPEKYEEELKREVLSDNGMKAITKIYGFYDFDGRSIPFLRQPNDSELERLQPVNLFSATFSVANALFYKYNHEFFYPFPDNM